MIQKRHLDNIESHTCARNTHPVRVKGSDGDIIDGGGGGGGGGGGDGDGDGSQITAVMRKQ